MEAKANALEQFVRENRCVSFSEIRRNFPWAAGDKSWETPGNHIIAIDLSQEGIDIIQGLSRADRIFPRSCTLCSLVAEDRIPAYPIGQADKSYATPRWLPLEWVSTPY
jgi:hypothetical protein